LKRNTKTKVFNAPFLWWQKLLAIFCCITILSPIFSVDLPGSQASPGEGEKNLVVIFAEQSLLSNSSLSSKIYRYASYVQGALPQTRTFVVPVSKDVSSGDMFAALEKLYLEGSRIGNTLYRLTGTVLVGEIPLPIIRTAAVDGSSVFPLTDFEDPAFLWDEVSQVFRPNEGNSQLQAEIFHGVIRAPDDSTKSKIAWLSNFFEKNHRYHTGQLSAPDQQLFFADLSGEAESVHPLREDIYAASHNHFQSDMAFLRYNQTMLKDVNTMYKKYTSDVFQFSDLPSSIRIKLENLKQGMTTFSLPDSFAYQRIKQMLPEYVQVTEGYLSKALPKINGTGRWIVKEDTADTIPELITRMDVMSREFIREFSKKQEQKIVNYIENKWQKRVPLLTEIRPGYITTNRYYSECEYPKPPICYGDDDDDEDEDEDYSRSPYRPDSISEENSDIMMPNRSFCVQPYPNYDGCYTWKIQFQPTINIQYHGKDPDGYWGGSNHDSGITTAEMCSLYRGSKNSVSRKFGEHSQLTELNHLYNRYPEDPESVYINNCEEYGGCCIMNINNPGICNSRWATWSVLDYQGGQIKNNMGSPSFMDCIRDPGSQAVKGFYYPWELDWLSYQELFFRGVDNYTIGGFFSRFSGWSSSWIIPVLKYKQVSSVVVHDEPKPSTITKAIQNGLSGAIPADEARRVSFQSQGGSHIVIRFPDVFSVSDSGLRDHDRIMEILKQKYIKLEEHMRYKISYENVNAYISYINAINDGIRHQGTRLVPYDLGQDTGKKVPLKNQVSNYYDSATLILRQRLSYTNNEDVTDAELWRMYYSYLWKKNNGGISDDPHGITTNKIDGITNTLTSIARQVTEYSDEASREIISLEEFYTSRGMYIRYYPYLEVGPYIRREIIRQVSNYSRWYWKHDLSGLFTSSVPTKSFPYYPPSPATKNTSPYPEVSSFYSLSERLDFPFRSIPAMGFLFGKDASAIQNNGEGVIPYYLEWQTLSMDEKHKRVFEIFWGNDKKRHVLGGPKTSYEYAAIRAGGDENSIWWEDKELLYFPGDDPEWDIALEESTQGFGTDSSKGGKDKNAKDKKATEEKDPCTGKGYGDGVSLLEWFPAFKCWMEDTLKKPIQIEMSNACSYTNTLDFDNEEKYSSIVDPKKADIPPGSNIRIFSSKGVQVPIGTETTVMVEFQKSSGGLISGGVPFRIAAKGGAKVVGKGQNFSETTYTGKYSFPVRIESSSASIQVIADDFSKRTLYFEPFSGGYIDVEEKSVSLPDAQDITIALKGSRGEVLNNYSGTAYVSVTDPSVADIADPQVSIVNGKGKTRIRQLVLGPISVSVTVPGFKSASLILFKDLGSSSKGERLLIEGVPEAMQMNESVRVTIKALDENGNHVYVPSSAKIRVTKNTEDILSITPLGTKGRFVLRSKGKVGTARIIAEHSTLQTGVAQVKVVDKIDKDDIRDISPNSLVTSILGSDYANFSESDDPIANTVLFSGRTQAVISTLNKGESEYPKVSVNKDGAVRVLSGGINAFVSSFSPLKVRVYDSLSSTSLSEFALSYPKSADFFLLQDGGQTEEKPGIFFDNFDESDSLTANIKNNILTLSYLESPVITIKDNGSINILDNRFALEYKTNDEIVNFDLLFEDNAVVGNIAFVGAQMTPIQYPLDQTSFFPIIGNDDGSLGFYITGDGEGHLLPSGGKRMEQAANVFAVGFNEDDNFALQLGSGVPVGKAAQFSFGPSGILLGDPTVSFSKDQKTVAGFDRGTGEEVLRNYLRRNDFVMAFDADGDNLPDILTATKRGEFTLLKNMGDLQFRNTGAYLEHSQSIAGAAAINVDGNRFDDIVILDKNGKLAAYKNQDTHLELYTDLSLPTVGIDSIQTADFDRDGKSDILAHQKNGVISVFWGEKNGYTNTRKTVVGSFGAKVQGGNLAINNTMVSMPNISQWAKNVYPLILGAPVSHKDGIETVLQQTGRDIARENSGRKVWDMLSGMQSRYPDSFEQSFSSSVPTESVRTGVFATLSDVPQLTVGLYASDPNGGVLSQGDKVNFTLRIKNESKNNLHFALAHILNPAIEINAVSLKVSDSWPINRDVPRIQTYGSSGSVYIVNIQMLPGETQDIRFTGNMGRTSPAKMFIRNNLALPSYPADGLPDISVVVPGVNGVLHYISRSKRQFRKYFEPNASYELPDFLEDTNGNHVPDMYEEDKNFDGIPDISQKYLNEYNADTDNDGIPDVWDETTADPSGIGMVGGLGDIVDNVMKYTQCRGGCLAIPINFAFLVPGKINIFDQIFGSVQSARRDAPSGGGLPKSVQNFAPGIGNAMDAVGRSVGNMADQVKDFAKNLGFVQKGKGVFAGVIPKSFPIFGTLVHFPFVCSGLMCNTPSSPFRIYVSPTLTGGVGIGICTGPYIWGDGVAIGATDSAKCMAFAPPVLNLCDDDRFEGKKKDFEFVVDYGNDSCSLVSDTSDEANEAKPKDASGLKGLLFQFDQLGEFSVSYDSGKNKRVMVFPWNWVYKQAAEFYAMMTTLPSITIYYPDFSSFSLGSIEETASNALNTTKMFGSNIQEKIEDISFTDISDRVDDVKKIFRPISGGTGKMTDQEKDELLKKYKTEEFAFREKANQAFGSVDELYEAFSAIPLVELEPHDVFIKVPYISRSHIFALRRDMDKWVDEAQREIEEAKKAWSSCSHHGVPEDREDCRNIKKVTDRIIVESEKLVITIRRNMQMLDKYLTMDDIIADIDNSISQWLSQIICMLDTSVLSLSTWFVKNKRRLEMWIELYYLMDAFKEIFNSLKDVFVDYENYCPFCQSDRGESHTGIFDIVFNVDISPPIIRFPRLPDIAIDLSQVKGGVILPVPRPQLHFVSLVYPKLEPLDLMGPPLWDIRLPGIPVLPDLPTVTALPAFPPTPVISLPDLPPAPRLPDFPSAIADILSLAKPIMYIFCIVNKMGSLPVGEDIELKSTIEALTARPTNKMFSFDFSGALFEDIVIPSVRRIDIVMEMNLDFVLGDGLVGVFQDLFDPWNDLVTDLRKEAKSLQSNLNYTLKNIGGANVDLDRTIDLEDIFSQLSPEMEILMDLKKEYASVFDRYLSEEDDYYSPSELRRKMGYDPIEIADEFPAVRKIQELKNDVIALQKAYKEEGEKILALGDVTKLDGNFVADSALASRVYDTTAFADLPEYRTPETPDADSLVKFTVLPQSETDSSLFSREDNTEPEAVSDIFESLSKDVSVLNSSGSDVVEREGFFAQCKNSKGEAYSERIVMNEEVVDNLENMFLKDMDGDGDEDMVINTNYSVLVKENYKRSSLPSHIYAPPRTVSLQKLLPNSEAVKNVIIRSGKKYVRVGFSNNFGDDLLGIQVDIRSQKEDFFLPSGKKGSGEQYTALLLPTRYVPDGNDPKNFSDQKIKVEKFSFSGDILVREFTSQYVRLPLPADKQWFIRIYEIRKGGLSTGSEIGLATTKEGEDIFSPLMIGNTNKNIMLFEDIDLNMPINDRGSDVSSPFSETKESEDSVEEDRPDPFSANIIWPEIESLTERESIADLEEELFDNLQSKSNPQDPQPIDSESEEEEDLIIDEDDPDADLPDESSEGVFIEEGYFLDDESDSFFPDFVDPLEQDGVILEWDSDGDGIFESSGENITFRPESPGGHTVTVRATDSAGNFSEEDIRVEVDVPKISLQEDLLSQGVVSGNVLPRIAGVPFAILRERSGRIKKLITPSAQSNGKYTTDVYGNYRVDNFSYTPGAVLRDQKGRELATIDSATGKLKVNSADIGLVSTSSGKVAAIYRNNGRVLAEVVQVADGNSDVELLPQEIDPNNAESFLPGVYLADVNSKNNIVFGSIPGDAPFFSGGGAVYENEQIIALFSVFGEPKIVDERYTFQIKSTDTSNEPIILQLVDEFGEPQFDFFVQSAGKTMYLAYSSDPEHKYYRFPKFLLSPDSNDQKEIPQEKKRSIVSLNISDSIGNLFAKNDFASPSLASVAKLFSSENDDLCPEVPEDIDGVEDNDGCPEYDFPVQFHDVKTGIYLAGAYSGSSLPLLDFWADIRPGDRIATAITSPDDQEIYSQSDFFSIPQDAFF
jgi:hypothetical protein